MREACFLRTRFCMMRAACRLDQIRLDEIGLGLIRLGWMCASLSRMLFLLESLCPSPTLSPTDPVPRGLLTLCPAASSGPGAQLHVVQRERASIRRVCPLSLSLSLSLFLSLTHTLSLSRTHTETQTRAHTYTKAHLDMRARVTMLRTQHSEVFQIFTR